MVPVGPGAAPEKRTLPDDLVRLSIGIEDARSRAGVRRCRLPFPFPPGWRWGGGVVGGGVQRLN